MIPDKHYAAAIALCGGVAIAVATLTADNTASVSQTPAERRIATARATIAKTPDSPAGYNELAIALAQRARETSDADYYVRADEAIGQALSRAPDNFEALKARAWVLLGQHRFADALALAETLNKRAPDDVMVYGLLTDASVELGKYDEAERAAQWMLDLRPGNLPALTRASYLRELFGDIEGALELMQMALAQVRPGEVEDRAWILVQTGHLEYERGNLRAAEAMLTQALSTFPEYHYALAALGKVRLAQGRSEEAADLLTNRYERARHPENLYDMAVALQRAGRQRAAQEAFAGFERQARAEMQKADNANRELVLYLAEEGERPAEAVRVARGELERRSDVFTRDAYAWALFKNGSPAQAKKEMIRVLEVGVRSRQIVDHAKAMGFRVNRPVTMPAAE
jgi:tetratricopeptide (TPR) repeat protein